MNHKVSLIIKACVQDVDVLYRNVKHITKQLSNPDNFDEVILGLDVKEKDFLRQYNSEGNWERLISVCCKLKNEGLVSDFIYPSENDITEINSRWFGLNSKHTHTFKKVPVAAQLFAFERAKNNLILQLDIDIIIGRLSHSHSFLTDMIKELENNKEIVSVGFNIFHGKGHFFKPYFGNFVPEVRFCLLSKERIFQLLPLPNKSLETGLDLSWYRSIEKKQKETGKISIRGGDSRSFFIHPQNNTKKDPSFLELVIKRVEQNIIPDKQIGNVDLAGTYNDWNS